MSNYELDHKLEHVYTLAAYAEVEKQPVNSRNYKRILEKQNKGVHELMKAAYEIPFYRARFEQKFTESAGTFFVRERSLIRPCPGRLFQVIKNIDHFKSL